MDIASLGIQIRTDGVAQATRDLDKLDRQSGRTERSAKSLQSVMGGFRTLLAGIGVGIAVREYVRLADTYTSLNAKLRALVTTSQQSAVVQAELFRQAQATGSAFENVADLYSRLGTSSEALAKNQGNLLRVTDLVNKSIALSGADTAAAAAVTRQFAQALAAGALRGDEFVSVMEGAPRLARAIADGLNVPIGKLRELASEGRLTADVVTSALISTGQQIDTEFADMPATVGRAMQQVRNSILLLVGDANDASGASRILADALSDVARELEGMARQGDLARSVATLFAGVVKGGAALLREYENAVQRTTIAIGLFAESYKGLIEVSQNAGLQGLFNEGSFLGGVRRMKGALDRSQLELDTWMERQRQGAPRDSEAGGIDFSRGAPVAPGERRSIALPGGKSKKGGDRPKRREVDELAEAYARLNGQLDMQIALFGDTSEAARVRYEVENGGLKLLDQGLKDQLVLKARALDMRGEEARAMEESIRKANEEAEARERGIAATSRLLEDMRFEVQLLSMTSAERERAIALRYADAAATDEQRRAIADLADEMTAAREAARQMDEFRASASNALTDLVTGAKSAKEAFRDFFDDLAKQITRMIAQRWIEQLFGAQGSTGQGTQGGNWISGLFGAMFNSQGGRAIGGPVAAGGVYQVGEYNRPELLKVHGKQYLIPGDRGQVEPMQGGTGGGGSRTVNQTFVIQGRLDARAEQQLARSQGREAESAMRRGRR